MLSNWPFSPDAATTVGDLLSVSETKDFSGKFKEAVKASAKEDALASKFLVNGEIRNSEFFGIQSIEELIKRAKGKANVVGIRAYYGLAFESLNGKTGGSEISSSPIKGADSETRPRIFLVAVDEKGNDIELDLTGLKDVPDGTGLGNGSPQPPFGGS